MSKKEDTFDFLVKNASPFITLSYVIDDAGDLLSRFHIHPQQYDSCFINLDRISDREEVLLTPDDVREFAKELIKFADCAETIIDTYND